MDTSSAIVLQTKPFTGPSKHVETQWQLIREEGNLVEFDVTSTNDLESISIPDLILDADQSYTWRARFADEKSVGEIWSEYNTFTASEADPFDNGAVPLKQRVEDDAVDLDLDGQPDRYNERYIAGTDQRIDNMIAARAGTGIESIQAMRILDVASVPGEENTYLPLVAPVMRTRQKTASSWAHSG